MGASGKQLLVSKTIVIGIGSIGVNLVFMIVNYIFGLWFLQDKGTEHEVLIQTIRGLATSTLDMPVLTLILKGSF